MFQVVAHESVILDLNSEQYFGLDDVGTRVWQLIVERGRLRDVFDEILDEYDVPPEVLERDLIALVAALSEQGLVVIEDAAESLSSPVHVV